MYLGSSPKRSRFWCALPEGTQIPRRPLEGTRMLPPGAGWDADVWMAPCSQEETHCLGFPPRPGVEYWHQGCPLTTRRGPRHHLGVLRGGTGEAVGGGFPITFCTV